MEPLHIAVKLTIVDLMILDGRACFCLQSFIKLSFFIPTRYRNLKNKTLGMLPSLWSVLIRKHVI